MKRILIVEDDALLNKTLAYNLSSDGWDVTPALNARTAADLLAGTEYDLVLLDINLPDGNGYDLCGLIKPEHPDTVVIFLTANDQESDQIRGYEAGAVDYITKPFSIRPCSGRSAPCSPCWSTTNRQRISMTTAGCSWTSQSSPPP
jgi:DNA-binding response OmpR family regulator